MMLEKPKRPRDLPIAAMKSLKPLPTAELAKKTLTTLDENLTLIVDDPILQSSTMREIMPLLPRIYKPTILHNYQLKTVKPIFQLKQKDDNKSHITTTSTAATATTLMEEINNNNENKQEFKQINDNLTTKTTTTIATTITESYDNNCKLQKQIAKIIDKNPLPLPPTKRRIAKSQVVYGSHNKSIIHSNGTQKENKQLTKSNENLVSYQLPAANRKIAKVLNKPQYACFLQNSNALTAKTITSTIKRCHSFNYKQTNEKKQNNDNNNVLLKSIALFDALHNSEQDTTTTTTMRNQTIRHSFNCLTQRKQEQLLNNSTSSSTLTSAHSLSSTSVALLRTRIPGNIIYYV